MTAGEDETREKTERNNRWARWTWPRGGEQGRGDESSGRLDRGHGTVPNPF